MVYFIWHKICKISGTFWNTTHINGSLSMKIPLAILNRLLETAHALLASLTTSGAKVLNLTTSDIILECFWICFSLLTFLPGVFLKL